MKYYLIAGEASGDLHGANLIRALKARDDKAEFRYWGGGAVPVSDLSSACRTGRRRPARSRMVRIFFMSSVVLFQTFACEKAASSVNVLTA